MFAEKRAMDDRNYVKLGGAAGVHDEKTRQYTNLESLPIEKYYLWRDLASEPYKKDFLDFKGGIYYYGPKDIDRFLAPHWREHLVEMNARLTEGNRDTRLQAMRRPILNPTKCGELVYEPFLGSGTTLTAAEVTERVCCGPELDPKHVDVIVQRWQTLTGKKAKLDGDGRTFDEIAHERVPVTELLLEDSATQLTGFAFDRMSVAVITFITKVLANGKRNPRAIMRRTNA